MCHMLMHFACPLSKLLTSVVLAEGLIHATHIHYMPRAPIDGWEHCHLCNNIAEYNHLASHAHRDTILLSATIYWNAGGGYNLCTIACRIVVPLCTAHSHNNVARIGGARV